MRAITERCPNCGAIANIERERYLCGSYHNVDDLLVVSYRCTMNRLDQLAKRDDLLAYKS